jgi:cytoskeletal protein RodZ
MKALGWIASAAAAVVVVGGGIWAATTLPASDEATEPETAYTGSYEPVETETPEPSVEPTEAVETPAADPSEVPVPVEPTPEASGAEDAFLEAARIDPAIEDLEMSDAEILEAGWQACAYVAEYGTTNLPDDIWVIDSGSAGIRNSFTATADELLCG